MAAPPYLRLEGLSMLGLPACLLLRARAVAWTWVYALAGVLAVEGVPIWGPVPVIVAELGALVLLSVASLKHDDRDTEEHRAEGEHDARLERDRQHLSADRQPEAVDTRQA